MWYIIFSNDRRIKIKKSAAYETAAKDPQETESQKVPTNEKFFLSHI